MTPLNKLVPELETENRVLRETLSKVNSQLGVQVIDTSDDDSISDDVIAGSPEINTRQKHLDGPFSADYYFVLDVSSYIFAYLYDTPIICLACLLILVNLFQTKGNRLYLDGTLKIKFDKIGRLKKMNDTYPKCTQDYDGNFVLCLLNAVFNKKMLRAVGDSSSLRTFPVVELQFVKSIAFFKYSLSKIYLIEFLFLVITFYP